MQPIQEFFECSIIDTSPSPSVSTPSSPPFYDDDGSYNRPSPSGPTPNTPTPSSPSSSSTTVMTFMTQCFVILVASAQFLL